MSPEVRLRDGNLDPFGPTEVGVVDPRDLVNPAGRSLLAQGQVSSWSSSQFRLFPREASCDEGSGSGRSTQLRLSTELIR